MIDNLSNVMTLQGEGSVMAEPDIAVVTLGVQTVDKDLKIAQSNNSQVINNIISMLKDMGINESDIKTYSYNIRKKYDYINGEQIDKGYEVEYILEITIRNIQQVGEVVDTAVENGANVIRGISFDVEDISNYYLQALNLALADAIEKAESMSIKLGVKIDQIPIKIVEEGYAEVAMDGAYYARSEYEGTLIEPGQKEIIARLKVLIMYQY